MTISILIATRNRAASLQKLLASIAQGTRKPDEILLVDNASHDKTQHVYKQYAPILPITYIREPKIGLAHARNAGIEKATKDIFCFVDDDCIVGPTWIADIKRHFKMYKNSVGVLGIALNATPRNAYSAVEYAYYERWIRRHIGWGEQTHSLRSGTCLDTKNVAFKKTFIQSLRFFPNGPFGSVSEEDVEMGERLYKKNHNIHVNPTIVVRHRHSQSFMSLIRRNFWTGYANEALKQDRAIRPRYTHTLTFHQRWLIFQKNTPKNLHAFVYVPLFFLYPLFSRIGRLSRLIQGW